MKTESRRMQAAGSRICGTSLTKGFALLAVLLVTVFAFSLCTPAFSGTTPAGAKYRTFSDLSGMTLGSQTGTMFDRSVGKVVSNIQNRYYDDIGGEILALRSGNVDAIGLDQPVAVLVTAQNQDFAIFPEMISSDQYGLALSKNSALTKDVSAVIERYATDGTLDQLKKKWFSGDPEQMKINYPEYENIPAPNGVLKYTHDSTLMPMSYVDDHGDSAGYEVELVLMIGKELGKKVALTQANFSALLASVSSGKADIVSGAITITDERREQVDFATSHYAGGIVLLCRKADLAETDTAQDGKQGGDSDITKVSDLDGKKIGVLSGTIYDAMTPKYIKNPQMLYFNSGTDMIQALQSGQIDGFLEDQPIAIMEKSRQPGLTYLPDKLEPDNYGMIFAKTEKGKTIRDQFNAYLKKVKEDGTQEEINKIWQGTDESRKTVEPVSNLPATNGELHCATNFTQEPFVYIKDNMPVGYTIDLLTRFCREYGYGLSLDDMEVSSLVPSVVSGKDDIGGGSISITEERKQSVDFSDPYYEGGVVVVVRKKAGDEITKKSFLTSLRESFEKTFIREQRWKLVLSGLWITILISLLSALFGTVLGFGLCMLRRGKNRVLSGICAVFIRIIQGIPMLVFLMVLYYIVFASANLNGIAVAVVAFAVNFGVYVSEMMRTGIDAVDRGQWEAAETLGFGKVGTFTKIIAPQALRHILPVYKGELISMVKMTSVVGYIAIQDLTKASDIIRSRTYDAFFPLIATALIYFILAWSMTLLLDCAEVRIDPKKRKPGLKGVNTSGTPDCGTADEGKSANHRQEKAGEIIRIEHLKKVYPNVTPLRDVNAEIMQGDIVTVIGPSGTGKSTLLRNINHLETPTSGSISVFGNRLPDSGPELQKVRQRMGMVFQSFNLFPHLTVIENIMLAPVELKKIPRQEAYDNAMRILTTVGLSLKAFSYPDELSGGQKQRVAIARALAMDPEIILFDEPTSALDPTMVGEVLAVIRSLAKQGLTMMIVTHEMKFARDVSTRIFYMDEGTVYEEGTPEQIFNHPQKEKTRQFVNRLKVYRYEIRSREYDFIELSTQLENFGQKHFIPAKLVNRLQTVIEELCVQTILPKLSENPQVDITVEYSDDPAHIEAEIVYNGSSADLLQQADKLSAVLIRNACAEICYTYENENRYRIVIR